MLYRFYEFELDPRRFQLRRGGVPVPIPRQVFDLILFLARNHERPVTRNELASHVWGGRVISDSSLSRCLFLARKALGDNPRQHRFIKTIHARGYWFVAPVEVVVDDVGVVLEAGPDSAPSDLPFAGRAAEMSLLLGGLTAAAGSRGTVVVVYGGAGIGKSRLCRQVTAIADHLGISSTFVDCAGLGEGLPLAPWIKAVSRLSADGDPYLFNALGSEATRGLEPGWERLRRFSALAELILRDAAISPRLYVLDNIDRADADTQHFLQYFADQLVDSRVMVVASTRASALKPSSPLVDAVRTAQGWQLGLEPLEVADVRLLVAGMGVREGELDIGRLHLRSGGNPLFLEELIRLSRSGAEGMPLTLVNAVVRRMEEVPKGTRDVLSRISVLGPRFELPAAAHLLGWSASDTAQCLGPAVDCGLIAMSGDQSTKYAYRHEIVHETLYEALSSMERAELHDRAAVFFGSDGRGDALFALAHHRMRSLPLGDCFLALEYSLAAAGLAEERLAFAQASDLLRNALHIADGVRDRVVDGNGIRLRLGAALIRSGRRDEGRSVLLGAMQNSGSMATDALAEAVLSLAPGFFAIEVGVCDSLLIALLERALSAPGLGFAVRAKLLGRLAMAMYWRQSSALDVIAHSVNASVEAATEADEPRAIAESVIWRVGALWSSVTIAERFADLRDIGEVGALGPSEEMVRRVFLIATAVELGDGAGQERELGGLEAEAALSREPHAQWYLPMFRSMKSLARGHLGEAEREVGHFVDVGARLGDVNVEQCAVAQAGEVAFQRGLAASALPALREHAQRFYRMVEYRCIAAFFELAAGDLESAHATASDSWRECEDLVRRMRLNSLLALSALAEVAFETGDEALGSALLPCLQPARALHAVAGYGVVTWGSLARPIGYLLALSGMLREAREAMESAVAANYGAGNVVWGLHAELGLSRILAREKTKTAIQRSIEIARSVRFRSSELGLRFLESRASVLTEAE